MKMTKINGEAGDVRGRQLVAGKRGCQSCYKDIHGVTSGILMKPLAFGELCSIMPLVRKKSQCKGSKKAKQRDTVALLASTNGEKEDPVLFGNQKIQGALGELIRPSFQCMQCFSQPKGLMTGEILDRVLSKWNPKLRSTGCSVCC